MNLSKTKENKIKKRIKEKWKKTDKKISDRKGTDRIKTKN